MYLISSEIAYIVSEEIAMKNRRKVMNTFMNWLANSFVPKSNKILSKPWISALGSTMQKVIPFILTGSVIFLYKIGRAHV